ncbi:MAG: hypothetical protein ACT4OO_03295 [Nitrospiraceae bacterium]
MRFKQADVVVLALAILVVTGVALLPSPRDKNPLVPTNADHQGVASEKDCVTCHTKNGVQPLPGRHPKRQDCFRCHRGGKDA